MRALRLAGSVAGMILALYLYFAFLHPRGKAREHPFFNSERTLAIAHQGGRGLWPENTLLAFERSLELGVDVLEMDLRGTSDGQIVVHHDASVERTTEGSGLVRELTLEGIRSLDAGYRFAVEKDGVDSHPYRGLGLVVPTLLEVLHRLPQSRLNLEMKEFDPELARSLCAVLRANGPADLFSSPLSTTSRWSPFVRPAPRSRPARLFEKGSSSTSSTGWGWGACIGARRSRSRSPSTSGRSTSCARDSSRPARAFNVRVQVWTVNEDEDLARMLAMGVDGILTDYPDRLLRLMGRLARIP